MIDTAAKPELREFPVTVIVDGKTRVTVTLLLAPGITASVERDNRHDRARFFGVEDDLTAVHVRQRASRVARLARFTPLLLILRARETLPLPEVDQSRQNPLKRSDANAVTISYNPARISGRFTLTEDVALSSIWQHLKVRAYADPASIVEPQMD